eukprot:gene4090-18747_t
MDDFDPNSDEFAFARKGELRLTHEGIAKSRQDWIEHWQSSVEFVVRNAGDDAINGGYRKDTFTAFDAAELDTGIKHDVPLETLLAKGWRLAFVRPYDEKLRESDIDALCGEWMMLAGRRKGSEVLSLCAADRKEVVCK